MPKITTELASNYENITRPVAMGVARDVMRLSDIDLKTPVYMPGEFDAIAQQGGEDKPDDINFGSNRRVKVIVEEVIRNESVMQQIIKQNEMPTMFEDRRLGISIRPVYMQSDITLTFQYICASRVQAKKWVDGIAARRAENRTSTQHQLEYDIPIQEGLLALLTHLHTLRENVSGYGESLPVWFKECQQRPFQLLATQDGDIAKSIVSVPEKQVQVVGWWEFTDIPKESKNGDTSTWTIEFSYKFMYHRCTHLYIVYPLMVHQQHIAIEYFDPKPRFSLEDLPKRSAIGIRALDYMDGYVDYFPAPADGLRYPPYDEWIPGKKQQPPKSVPGASWMLSLDQEDVGYIINLSEFPDIRLTLETDTYFRSNYSKLTTRGAASVLFTLYVGDIPMGDGSIMVDKDLNVRATVPLDLRKAYHLRMSFPTYYPQFSKDAIRNMQLNSDATLQVFQSILPSLNVEYARSIYLAEQYLPIDYIVWFYKYPQDHGIGYNNDGGGNQDHVGSSGIGQVNTGIGSPGHLEGLPEGTSTADDWSGNGAGGAWTRRSNNGNRFVQFLAIGTVKESV
jgi:hypothetical protein